MSPVDNLLLWMAVAGLCLLVLKFKWGGWLVMPAVNWFILWPTVHHLLPSLQLVALIGLAALVMLAALTPIILAILVLRGGQALLTGIFGSEVAVRVSDPTLRRILVTPKVDLHFRKLMDSGGSLLVNLSKGQLGEHSASVLGSFLVSIIGLAALSRADAPTDQRPPFFLYVDEFQTFTTLAFANMMAELRKYGLGLTLAHQHFNQLDPDIRHAVLGNAGTLMAFRVGAEDAPLLAREFQPKFDVEDLINLPNRRFYLKLMIDGSPSRPFSARTGDLRGSCKPC